MTAMGIVYNKTVIEKATGETFDPSTIKSNADLEALCEKIQAGGVAPIMFTGVDWSLGSHYLSQVFSGIQGDAEAQQNFINSLKDGSAELKSNDAWNSVMDTFDIIAKYNYNANDPLVGNTDIDGQAIAKGDVAMWFMGDWAWNYIKDSASADDEFGLMPCPLTGKEEDAVNTELGVFCSKGYCIDASQNSEEQQEAGKKLVEFFCVEKAHEMSDLLDMALPFSKVDVSYDNPLVFEYASFKSGCADHNLVNATWELRDRRLTEAYKELLERYGKTFNGELYASVRITTSDVGSSGANIFYTVSVQNQYIVLGENLKVRHKNCKGTEDFNQNMASIFEYYKEALQEVLRLSEIWVNHPANAMIGVMKQAGFSKKLIAETVERFRAAAGDVPCSAYEIYCGICDVISIARQQETNARGLLLLEEKVAACVSKRWHELDMPGEIKY